ncbi:MAG: putative PEP-binding protein [Alkaliphilus sp.]
MKEVDFFKEQIRAILRASQFGYVKIMIPMISTVDEILETRNIINQCKQELIDIGIEVANNVEVGIMIEVPSAGLISDLLAEEVDFFSIGTNDLIQYTMAADRMNKNVSYLYHPYHPAFIRMLKMVIDNAHGKGIKVAMCGELAGDVDFIPILIGLGLDEFSMNANALLKSKWVIRKTSKRSAEELVNTLLTLKTAGDIRRTIKEYGEKELY